MDLIISYSQYNFMIDESSITYDLVFLELGINILEKIHILVYSLGCKFKTYEYMNLVSFIT